MKLRLLASALLFAIAFNTSPNTYAQGSLTHCGNWLKGGNTRTALEHWVVGYLAGMSTVWDMQGLRPENPGGKIKRNSDIFLFIDSHCRINSSDDIAIAAVKLFRELSSQR